MWLEITTKTGKKFSAQRCYVSDLDGVLNIGLVDASMSEAAIVFGDPNETEEITCYNPESEETFHHNGYTFLTLMTYESRLNGAYLVLRKP